jgi:hypothetical protein
MKMTQVLGAVLFAMLVLGMISVESASARDEWLVSSRLVGLTEKISIVEEVKALFLLTRIPFNPAHVVCSYKLLGTVNGLNPNGRGTDTVTKLTNLSNVEMNPVNCEVLHSELGACSGSLLALMAFSRLPWLSELLLRTGDTTPRDMFVSGGSGTPGFLVTCTSSGGTKLEESCEGNFETNQTVDEANGTVTDEVPEEKEEKCSESGASATLQDTAVLRTLNSAALATS